MGGSVDRLALQISQRGDGLAAVSHHIQHAAGVQGQHLDGALGLVIDHAGGVGGQRGDVNGAIDQSSGDVAGVGFNVDVIVASGGAGSLVGNQLGHTEAGGAVQGHDIDRQLGVQRGLGRSGLHGSGSGFHGGRSGLSGVGSVVLSRGVGVAAGAQGQQHGSSHKNGKQFGAFHDGISFL